MPDWEILTNEQLTKATKKAKAQFTTVYPILIQQREPDSVVPYSSYLAYIASSLEKAEAWCGRNKDIELRDDPERDWWFTINQEVIDGDYTGIGGIVKILDWNAKEIDHIPCHTIDIEEEILNVDKMEPTCDKGDTNCCGGSASTDNPDRDGCRTTSERQEDTEVVVI